MSESDTPAKVHIVMASDNNYLPLLEVAKESVLRSCKTPDRLVWHIFDETVLQEMAGVHAFREWNGSLMPYLRLWLPRMLSDVDWIVYSDVDTVWNRDVCAFYDLALQSASKNAKSIYWVRDFRSSCDTAYEWLDRASNGAFDKSRYCCSGVCVMNLRKMRETGFTERALKLFEQYGVPYYPDQDVLNLVFNQDSGILPSVWDAMGDPSNLPTAGEPCTYHITGIGRHFHDLASRVYPPQYQLWWNVRNGTHHVHWRSRFLSALWCLHGLAKMLPLRIRERVVRQWFFAKELVNYCDARIAISQRR